jgi:O-antigen/teichoic acid export membrane protein
MARILHKRSLSVCIVAFLLSFLGLGVLAVPLHRWDDRAFLLQVGGVALAAFLFCCVALINLVRDVERGYSPSRCSLAAVVLFFAFVSVVPVGFHVLWVITHPK